MQRLGALFYGKVQALSVSTGRVDYPLFPACTGSATAAAERGNKKKNVFKGSSRLNKEGGLDFRALVCANANSHENTCMPGHVTQKGRYLVKLLKGKKT